MPVTASQLRADVYNLLDRVLETGEPLEIERGGRLLRIVAVQPPSWMDRLVTRPGVVTGDPDDLDRVDGTSEWRIPEP